MSSSAVSKKDGQQVASSGSQGMMESKEHSASASANVRAVRDPSFDRFHVPIHVNK